MVPSDKEPEPEPDFREFNELGLDPSEVFPVESGDICKVATSVLRIDDEDEIDWLKLRREFEPWLSALFQSEHLSLLVGSGLTSAICANLDISSTDMGKVSFDLPLKEELNEYAEATAEELGRGEPNIEDQIRAARTLIDGLKLIGSGNIIEDTSPEEWEVCLSETLEGFVSSILSVEEKIRDKSEEEKNRARDLLVSFLLSFASRLPSRDRLHLFTTNYDRILEWGCDAGGIRLLDRFVGRVKPKFRASRLDIDYHYNPPGIRGEPRFVEGVAKLTKLHGSIDWIDEADGVVRASVPFGSTEIPGLVADNVDSVLVYPNPSKAVETSFHPYSELFMDLSAEICRPNSVLVTYGYGFGDSHVNRAIQDMLTIPSTHLLILAYSDPGGRISGFIEECGKPAQVSYIIGRRVAKLENLVSYFLPKPSIDSATKRRAKLLEDRGELDIEGNRGQRVEDLSGED